MSEILNENSSLLGSSQSLQHPSLPEPTTAIRIPLRIHFLDNLRATLTILLILHHSILETISSGKYNYTKAETLPFALFTAVNQSYLWSLFFFTSGYSTSLSLLSKSSDRHFFISRTLKIGVPALVYACGGRFVLFLCLSRWEDIFGNYKTLRGFFRLSGPIDYVFVLLVLDYVHLFVRWVGRRWYTAAAALSEPRIFNSLRPTLRLHFYALVTLSISLLVISTFLSCIGLHLTPNVLLFALPYDRPGPDVPISCVVAYLAGIHFTSMKKYLTVRPTRAYATLSISLFLAFLSLDIVQDLSPPLWSFIEISYPLHINFFVDGGFNFHTIFFTLWNTFVFFAIPVSLISIFIQVHWTTRDWGFWTRRTYVQTYVNMIPIPVAIYYLRDVHNLVLKIILVGISGVIGSWLLAFTPFLVTGAVRVAIRGFR